jgi:hypothetical protein
MVEHITNRIEFIDQAIYNAEASYRGIINAQTRDSKDLDDERREHIKFLKKLLAELGQARKYAHEMADVIVDMYTATQKDNLPSTKDNLPSTKGR